MKPFQHKIQTTISALVAIGTKMAEKGFNWSKLASKWLFLAFNGSFWQLKMNFLRYNVLIICTLNQN
jgi:hypothetical protein